MKEEDKMKRLTRRSKVNEASPTKHLNLMHMDTTSEDTLTDILEKLAYYEDLEESGRLPSLYIGCDVYFRVKGMNQFGEYVDFVQTQKIGRIDIDINGILYCTASVKFIISDVGKSVFLTREEAKLKLKEMSDD